MKDPQSIETHWGGGSTDSEYFDILNDVTNNIHSRQLQEVDVASTCLDPRRIWVLDEMSTLFQQATNGSDKDNITVVVAAKVDGEK